MTVKSLTRLQKQNIGYYYANKTHAVKELAALYQKSVRTIGRVLEEEGYAKPKERALEEAKRIRLLMEKNKIGYYELVKLIQTNKNKPIPTKNQLKLNMG